MSTRNKMAATCQGGASNERGRLRAAQTAEVMPMIGPLLDAWEGADLSEEPELAKWLKAINRAMETAGEASAHPAAPKPAPKISSVDEFFAAAEAAGITHWTPEMTAAVAKRSDEIAAAPECRDILDLVDEFGDESRCETYNGWSRRRPSKEIRAEIETKLRAALGVHP